MISWLEVVFSKIKNTSGEKYFYYICFAFCFFLFQLIEFTVNDYAGIVFGPDFVTYIYSVGIFFSAVGFFAFSIFYKISKSIRGLKILLFVLGIFLLPASVTIVTSSSTIAFSIGSFAALFFCGVLNSAVYFCFAERFGNSLHLGRIVGTAMGIMVLLQFAVQNLFTANSEVLFVACVVISIFVILLFILKNPFETKSVAPSENSAKNPRLLILVAATAVMTVIIVLSDGICVEKHAEGFLSVSAMSRLFYAVSLVVAGFVADIKNKKYFSLITVCVLFASAISIALISPSTYFVAISMLYVYSGFYVVFLTVNFLEIAPQLKNPRLWAGMGRIVRSLVTSLTVLPTLWLYNRFGNIILIASSCLLSVLTLLILLKDINISLFGTSTLDTDSVDIVSFSSKYSLTKKEIEVLKHLLLSEKNIQEIADEMFISRRVLQRHISSIYRKTETSTRVGLLRKLMTDE